jgi:undecaprenyl-diphosphatase
MMDIVEAVVLGLVQGATEFLPVSSSAHLRVVPPLFGWRDPGAPVTAVLQLGTMVAELLYFRRDLLRIGAAWGAAVVRPELRGTLDARLGWYLICATVPIAVLGLAAEDKIEAQARALQLTGAMLIVFALVLLAADRRGTQSRSFQTLGLKDAIIMGAAQTLALIPGVSRSGATLSAGLFLDLDRAAAARFSFLLSIPAVVLSGVYQLTSLLAGTETSAAGPAALVVGTVVAFVVGYAAIAALMRWLQSHTVMVFVAYRLVAGVGVLALASAGAID